jgi:uncharacterized protein Yka (UPF0111/DUF47 family)
VEEHPGLYEALITSTASTNAIAEVLKQTNIELREDVRQLEKRVREVEDDFEDKLDKLEDDVAEILSRQKSIGHMLHTVEWTAIVGGGLFFMWDWLKAHLGG